ncbi:hypothetical protein FKM82_025465 [Ascaphus truei]
MSCLVQLDKQQQAVSVGFVWQFLWVLTNQADLVGFCWPRFAKIAFCLVHESFGRGFGPSLKCACANSGDSNRKVLEPSVTLSLAG